MLESLKECYEITQQNTLFAAAAIHSNHLDEELDGLLVYMDSLLYHCERLIEEIENIESVNRNVMNEWMEKNSDSDNEIDPNVSDTDSDGDFIP